MSIISQLSKSAADAARTLIRLTETQKNSILLEMANRIRANKKEYLGR